jgi:hypothetical protein
MKLYTAHMIEDLLRARVNQLEDENEGAPLSFNQDLLIEDICIALGIDVRQVLDYQPSAANLLHVEDKTTDSAPTTETVLFMDAPPQRPKLAIRKDPTPCPQLT